MSDDSDNEAEGTPETPDYKARFLSWATGKIGKILPESWVRSSPVYQDSTRVEQAHHTKQIAAFRNGKNAQIETANAGKTAAEARSTELEKTVEKLTAAKTAAETKNTALTEENTALETKMEVTKKSAQNYAGLAKAQREKATALVRVVEAGRCLTKFQSLFSCSTLTLT